MMLSGRSLKQGLVPAIAVFGLVLAGRQASAQSAKGAGWIAQDAAIYLEIAHPEHLIDRATSASFQQMLYAVPAYSRYLKNPKYKEFRSVVEFVSGKLGTTWDKGLRDLAGGGIVAAVEAEPGKAPRVIVAITPRDAAFLTKSIATLNELARKDAADKKKPDPIKAWEHRGVAGFIPEKGAYAVVDGTLVVADGPDTLKSVVNRARDGAKSFKPLVDDPEWQLRKKAMRGDAFAWGLVRLDRLRAIDKAKFTVPDREKTPAGATFFLGSWVEVIRKAPWAAASLTWTDRHMAVELNLPNPPGGYPDSLKGFLPPKGSGAAPLIMPPGVIGTVSLWRDFSAIWEARTELLPPETVQGLAQLDTTAGQFFGGRDFGSGVLGALSNHWRLVIARQNLADLKPAPDVKYPAFALIMGLRPEDDEFAQQLKVAFQSFIGLVNLGGAQTKAPPLEMGSETVEGVTIATSHFKVPKIAQGDKPPPVHLRYNFSPSVAQVGNDFILSSSVALTRDLIKALKNPPAAPAGGTLVAEADGPELVKLLELNRSRLVMQNMLERGNDKSQAEEGVSTLFQLLRYLGHGRLMVQDGTESVKLALDFALGQ